MSIIRLFDMKRRAQEIKESTTVVHPMHKDLAARLSVLHGDVTEHSECHGIHLHMACPACLVSDGTTELRKKHLSINISKKSAPCCCHKSEGGHKFRLEELLEMPSLDDRGIRDYPRSGKPRYSTMSNALEKDADGRMVPIRAGKLVPVTSLPSDHPAIEYLRNRQFTNLQQLVDRYQLSLCVAPNESRGKVYPLPFGFTTGQAGKLVFTIVQDGLYEGWQARTIEKAEGDFKYELHNDCRTWVPVARKSDCGAYVGLEDPAYNRQGMEKCLLRPKYHSCRGMMKSNILPGYDSCVKANKERDAADLPRVIVLCEGIFDAAALGPLAVPLLGASISPAQVELVRKIVRPCIQERRPDVVIYIADNDKKGQEAADRVSTMLQNGPVIKVVTDHAPLCFKDAGELGDVVGPLWLEDVIERSLAVQ